MRESEIEAYFVRRVKEAGGLQRKFVSPGHRGVPDRVVAFKGNIGFVELKAEGKTLREDQTREHIKLLTAGCFVITVSTKEGVEYVIDRLNK